MTDYEVRSGHCRTCGTGLRVISGVLQPCPWPDCPDYGMPPDIDAADPGPPRRVRRISHIEAAWLVGPQGLHGATDAEIEAFERELTGAGTRSLDGAAAYAALEMRAWLEQAAAVGELIDIEIEDRWG